MTEQQELALFKAITNNCTRMRVAKDANAFVIVDIHKMAYEVKEVCDKFKGGKTSGMAVD